MQGCRILHNARTTPCTRTRPTRALTRKLRGSNSASILQKCCSSRSHNVEAAPTQFDFHADRYRQTIAEYRQFSLVGVELKLSAWLSWAALSCVAGPKTSPTVNLITTFHP